ncbi:MAG: type II toxin-antitoxin system VapC family toxin [Trueperaceae bacterium]
MRSVLATSALLVYLNDEAGADVVEAALEQGCIISSVNLAEVFSKLAELGGKPKVLAERLENEGILHQTLEVFPFRFQDALELAALKVPNSLELSLGDRVCLALGRRLELPILTADTAWLGTKFKVTVTVIR